jgi:hypothetical protein
VAEAAGVDHADDAQHPGRAQRAVAPGHGLLGRAEHRRHLVERCAAVDVQGVDHRAVEFVEWHIRHARRDSMEEVVDIDHIEGEDRRSNLASRP